VQIHGIGDGAVRAALDILTTLPAQRDGVRHRVEHAQLVHPDDAGRFGAHGIVASMQPCQIASDEAVARLAWGRRTANTFPLRSIAEAGGMIAFGTDAPVESPSPWPGIALAVSRTFHPEQSIDLDRAIRGACLDPAMSAGERHRGRLVAGQIADLVVVDAAVFDEPIRPGGALASCRPVATVIDGEVMYRAPGFDP
jgi:predicted amidohydrolase YtcJ